MLFQKPYNILHKILFIIVIIINSSSTSVVIPVVVAVIVDWSKYWLEQYKFETV